MDYHSRIFFFFAPCATTFWPDAPILICNFDRVASSMPGILRPSALLSAKALNLLLHERERKKGLRAWVNENCDNCCALARVFVLMRLAWFSAFSIQSVSYGFSFSVPIIILQQIEYYLLR